MTVTHMYIKGVTTSGRLNLLSKAVSVVSGKLVLSVEHDICMSLLEDII